VRDAELACDLTQRPPGSVEFEGLSLELEPTIVSFPPAQMLAEAPELKLGQWLHDPSPSEELRGAAASVIVGTHVARPTKGDEIIEGVVV
jgi:hypothetical protein